MTAWYFPCERIQASFGRLRTFHNTLTRAKRTALRTSEFSLIELLVVVAINSIMGGVGLVGYQAYISQTQDATTKDNFEFLKRTLDQDIVLVSNELAARSKFSEGLTKASKCYELRYRYIRDMNLERKLNALTNPQTATYRVTFGGASVTALCP